ncbi:MAG TPA: hypothetical protein VE422_17290 [Terriglobia bacterium]|nr:hypothetical protein [Terriglobia bacterium]
MEPSQIKGPPRILKAIVTAAVPHSLREDVLGDLWRGYRSPGKFIKESAKALSTLLPGRLRRSFNIALVSGQACALCLFFLGAPFSAGLIAGLLLALGLLSLRDAHTYPAESPGEAFMDAFMAVTFVVVAQLLIGAMSAFATAQPLTIWRGGAASFSTLFLLRMAFHQKKPDGPREHAEHSYRMACVMNVMWLIAWVALLFTNPDSSFHSLNILTAGLPVLIIAAEYRGALKGMSGPGADHVPKSIFQDHEREELMRKRSLLWMPRGILAEVLFLAVMVVQFAAGIVSHPDFDRFRLGTNIVASLMLAVVWRYVRKANRSAWRLIQAEIDRLDAKAAR